MARTVDGPDWWSAESAADAVGYAPRYLRRLLQKSERAWVLEGVSDPSTLTRLGEDLLLVAMRAGSVAHDNDGHWVIHRDAVRALAEDRKPKHTIVAYDLTFSVPKEVSVVWARGEDSVRSEVIAAVEESVAAGVRYLERHALEVRVRGGQRPVERWVGADFLHVTSRALDPQLHHHVLVLNRAEDELGERRAVDGRLLFLHAKTAGYVAAAELRHQMATRLGVEHAAPVNGIARILGVDRSVVEEMSTRRREIEEAVSALGVDSAPARQVAAYQTRAEKDGPHDFDEVADWWGERMDALGFTDEALRSVLGRVDGPRALIEGEFAELERQMLRSDGITEHEAQFDRRAVVQAIASFAEERLPGDAVDELADRFLAHDDVARLEGTGDAVIRLEDGVAIQVPSDGTFSTRAMLRLEARAIDLYDSGREANIGVVADEVLRATFADPRFDRLSGEQRQFVDAFTTSGMRIQAGVGRAGSGKTTSMEAAVAAWRADGRRVIGAAVGGTQSILLGEEATGEGRTVASLLFNYFTFGDTTVVDDKTVILVDEASLLSTHDAALLERMVTENPGAILRLIGDQEQHSSVAAGGFFRFLVDQRAVDVPELSTVYRQQGVAMAEVRLALDEYREGMIHEAFERLERDGKITEASSVTEAYDLITAAWYVERQRRIDDPARRLSSMTAERHHERLELNTRARAMLTADGTLSGPALVVDGVGFQAGDEVIARVGDHDLHAEGAARGEWVRNGALGVVRDVRDDRLIVEFERWGSVEITSDFIGQEIAPGLRGGIMHSYAMTTFAAQGATMAASMPLMTDASSRAGVYVGITRPQFDLNAVAIRYDKVVPPVIEDDLPIVRSEIRDLVATANALDRDRAEQMATASDPDALAVVERAASRDLSLLDPPSRAKANIWSRKPLGVDERSRTVGLRGIVEPPVGVVEHLGERPSDAADRRRWDTAVSAIAVYRERVGLPVEQFDGDEELAWAIGERPADAELAAQYDETAGVIRGSLDVGERAAPEPQAPDAVSGAMALELEL